MRNILFSSFQINGKGRIKRVVWRTVIYSDHRFAYEEAQDIIETQGPVVSEKHSLRNGSYTVDRLLLMRLLL